MRTTHTADVLLIGGGLLGLLSAYYLNDAGLKVTLLERGRCGQESSWAGGGIVSPLYPWRYPEAITALAHESQCIYPTLIEHLLKQTGQDAEFYRTGMYWLDPQDPDVALRWATRQNLNIQVLEGAALRHQLPAHPTVQRALYRPELANIRPPRLVAALRAYLEQRGVCIVEDQEVLGLCQDQERIIGARTATQTYHAAATLLTTGAWTAPLLASLGHFIPLVPRKGQMLLYRTSPGRLRHMLLDHDGRYVIPRRDGHILVGSTLEDVGYEKRPTEWAHSSLRESAHTLLPELQDAQLIAQWTGLRPGSPDGIPWVGPVPQHPGLWLNCGHFRNGLVLAPASCKLLAQLVVGAQPDLDPRPYRLDARRIEQ